VGTKENHNQFHTQHLIVSYHHRPISILPIAPSLLNKLMKQGNALYNWFV